MKGISATLKNASFVRYRFTHGKYRRYLDSSKINQQVVVANPDGSDQVHGPYKGALLNPKWKNKRAEILMRDGYRCLNCGNQNQLQVHHRQYHFITLENRYKFPWEYPSNLLITLCQKCNQKGHSQYKVPTIKI